MKNKIVVLRMKDLIKKAVFLVIGIIIIFFFIGLFSGGEDSAYIPGTYKSDIVLNDKPVELNVTLDENSIKSITLSELNETQEVFYPSFNSCFEDISKNVIEAQSIDVELNSDYEVTGRILLLAIDNAVKQGLNK